MSKMKLTNQEDLSTGEIEESSILAPRFDADGLVPAVVTHAESGQILMLAYMNAEALARTIDTREAHYWSRSRNELWHKGATSGQIQKVVEIRTDCDQDAIWLKVIPGGDGGCCHVGFESCFYRKVVDGKDGPELETTAQKLKTGK